jgi:hypothetical protein
LGGRDHSGRLIPWVVASCPPSLSPSPLFFSSRSSSPFPPLTKRFYLFQALLNCNRLKKGAADSEYAPEMGGMRCFDECLFHTSGFKCLITKLVLVSYVTHTTGDWVCCILTGEESAPLPHCRRRRFPAEGRGLSPAAAVCQGCSSSGGYQNPSHYSLSIPHHLPIPTPPQWAPSAALAPI